MDQYYSSRHARIRKFQEMSNSNLTLWSFLNSSFGIWLMSSIVLGLLTYSFNFSQSYFEAERIRSATILQLDVEISNRLARLSFAESIRKSSPGYFSDILLSMEIPERSIFPISTFEGYKNRGLKSLIWELHFLVDDNERESINRAIMRYSELDHSIFRLFNMVSSEIPELEHLASSIFEMKFNVPFFPNLPSIEELLYRSLNLDRWGNPFNRVLSND